MSTACDPRYCNETTENCQVTLANWCASGDNISDVVCQRIKKSNPTLYNEIQSTYCLTNNASGENFKTTACEDFCEANPGQCDRTLRDVCANKSAADSAWKGVCSCWYNDTIYNTFYKSLDDLWVVPSGTLYAPPECGYPDCKSVSYAAYRPDTSTCPATSITSCVQNVTVDATGAVVTSSPITISQEAECKSSYKKKKDDSNVTAVACTTTSDCSTDQTCNGGQCIDNPCSADSDCSVGKACRNSKCALAAESSSSSSTTTIVLVLVGIVVLGLIAFAVLKSQKKKPANVLPAVT